VSDERPQEEREPDEVLDAAARLLDREPPEAYIAAWKRSLRRTLGLDEHADRFSAGIFRVGEELFALATDQVEEVHPLVPVRSVPGRTNDVFRGIVSLRGEIHLCADLRALFGLEEVSEETDETEKRLLVVDHAGERWALIVDAVLDFERFETDAVRGAQVTVSKAAVHFTDGVVETQHGPAARIDGRRLFDGLARSLA
jgi:chemotaxis-related protein WspD